MYIFKNAMKKLVRNRGRNILVFLILLAAMMIITICAMIRQAADRQVTYIDGSVYYEATEDDLDLYPSDILLKLAHKENRCVIMVTHSKDVAAFADEIYQIAEGRLTLKNK